MKFLFVALVALLLAGEAFAADGAYPNATCSSSSDTVQALPTIQPGNVVSYCPVTTTTQLVRVKSYADCNWNADTSGTGAGSVTLTAKKCSGSATAANDCKNTLTDSLGSTTITSGDPSGSFGLDSGVWLITASGTAANGLLLCTGR